jgi:replicative DNA helicase Mcm
MTEIEQEIDSQQKFEAFFKQEKYRRQFAELSVKDKKGIDVEFGDLVEFDTYLAECLIHAPEQYLEYARNAAMNQLRIEDVEYASKLKSINVRIYGLFDVTPLRNVGSNYIGKLVMINGVVVKATIVKPKVLNAAFECKRCGERTYVKQVTAVLRPPFQCSNPKCERKGAFELVQEESEFVDLQEIWVQESPEELPPGQLPRTLRVRLIGDLVDSARPGDNVSVVGTVNVLPGRSSKGSKLNVFSLFLEANSIKVLGKEPEAIPTLEEVNRIQELAKDPWIHRKIINSIAPSIYGYEHIKEAIMYLLFGGVAKELPDIKIRGELNILLIGDPGTAKSQLLQYVARIAPRGLYTSGRGTTAAGLTAAVLKDKTTGQMSLEAGALILADKGVACIDEIDKMKDEDRVAIHEAMEQHTVSIAKGGIVATLNARTAVLAAANPVLGRYDQYRSVAENLALPITLLSRFDLIFLMRDIPELEKDSKLCRHILNIHRKSHADPPIPPTLLRKYIGYARSINPTISDEAAERIQQFYLKMRKASAQAEGYSIAIGPRQLEALVRIAEARARAALRKQVTAEDAEAAIRIMMRCLEEVGIDVESGRPDIDLILTGKPKTLRDMTRTAISVLVDLEKEMGMVDRETYIKELEKHGVSQTQAERIIKELTKEGVIFSPREGYLKKT